MARGARNTRPLQLTYPYMGTSDVAKGRYFRAYFKGQIPAPVQAVSGSTGQTASQGQTDYINVPGPGGHVISMFQTTAQTLTPVYVAGSGLEIGLDEVDNESVEYVFGGNPNDALNPLTFAVGTDPDCFIRAKIKIVDVSGNDQFLLGFRSKEAFAVPTSFLSTGDGVYTDFCGIGFATSVTTATHAVSIASDTNNSGSTTVTATGFSWADGKTHVLEARMVGGKIFFLINGVKLGDAIAVDGTGAAITSQQTYTSPSYTWNTTSNASCVPFLFSRYDTTTPGAVYIQEVECGFLRDVGKDPNGENRNDKWTTFDYGD